MIKPIQTSQRDWDVHAGHPLQSWAWGEFRKTMGVDVVRHKGGLLTFHKIPHTPWTIGYFPKGPIPTNEMIGELLKIGREKNAIFIQLEPNVICHCEERSDVAISKNQSTEIASLIARNDNLLRLSHHPLFTKYTFVLDLTKSEDELLKDMHPKTRYNIKVAQKHGVVIAEDNSPQAFEVYLELTQQTTERQGFYAHSTNYHKKMWEIMRNADIAHLFTASYKGSTLAAWIVFVWKDTVYYPYGASSRNHREIMAPNLLLWEIAKWAKKQGLKYFDLWGALGPSPDPNDPWYGFHRFKEGYHPKLIEFIGSYDLVINPLLYKFYKIADTIRWFLLKLKLQI